MSISFYDLGQLMCSSGGREFHKLLENRRSSYLASLLDAKTSQETLTGLAHSIRTLDSLLATLDKGLIVYCKVSNAAVPEWRKDQIRIPEKLEITREE